MAPEQWSLYNDGSLGPAYSAGCDLNILPVWSNFTTGSSNVIVAVIDEGVSLEAMGDSIYQEILDVAGGKPTKAELLGHDELFGIGRFERF